MNALVSSAAMGFEVLHIPAWREEGREEFEESALECLWRGALRTARVWDVRKVGIGGYRRRKWRDKPFFCFTSIEPWAFLLDILDVVLLLIEY